MRRACLVGLVACGGAAAEPPEPPPAPVAVAAPADPVPEPAAEPAPFAARLSVKRFAAGVTVVGLDADLPAQVQVSVIPDADLPPALTRSVTEPGGTRRLVPIEHPTWKALPPRPGQTANAPFRAVVLYPAAPAARRLAVDALTGLPETIPRAVVTTAVDADGDDAADWVWADWCCGDHAAPWTPTCPVACAEVWHRGADGGWSVVELSGTAPAAAP